MQKRHTDRKLYFKELADTSQKYFLPFLEKEYGAIENATILEIGCGDGGNLYPFIKRGCKVTGIDISEARINNAKEIFRDLNCDATLICSDIFKLEDIGTFDIVIVHDVIEHIENKKEFLSYIQKYVAHDGVLYIAFPAWQMPFGGHQQICKSKFLSHFPFFHLFPKFLYKKMLQWGNEDKGTIDELISIKECGLRIEQFRNLIRNGDVYGIVKEELYFINPHYETKFGFAPRKLNGFIGNLPYIRNFFCTSCFYLLKKKTTL